MYAGCDVSLYWFTAVWARSYAVYFFITVDSDARVVMCRIWWHESYCFVWLPAYTSVRHSHKSIYIVHCAFMTCSLTQSRMYSKLQASYQQTRFARLVLCQTLDDYYYDRAIYEYITSRRMLLLECSSTIIIYMKSFIALRLFVLWSLKQLS